MTKVNDVHVSYEGEGDLLGVKTLFCRHPGLEVEAESLDLTNVGALFVTTEEPDSSLFLWLLSVRVTTTIETPLAAFIAAGSPSRMVTHAGAVRWFLVANEPQELPPFLGFIKVRSLDAKTFAEDVLVANAFAALGHRVLLMPEFQRPAAELGELMLSVIDDLHCSVRLAPPMQQLLGIR